MSRYPDADLRQVSISLRPETLRVAESMQQASRRHSEMWDMSRSEAIRELVQHGIEEAGENPDLEALIDDGAIASYQRQKRHEQRRRELEALDYLGGWRDRVGRYLDQRLAGSDPHPPDIMEEIAREGYEKDMLDLCEEAGRMDEAPEHRDWLDAKLERYRQAWESKQLTPEKTFADSHEAVELGSDLWTLRENAEETVADLVGAIESDKTDPDALVTRLSKQWAVSEAAVWTLLDLLTPEEVDNRQALTGETDRSDLIEPDRTELLSPDVSPDLLTVNEQATPSKSDHDHPEPEEPVAVEADAPAGISDGGVIEAEQVEAQHDDLPHEPDHPTPELIEEAKELIEQGTDRQAAAGLIGIDHEANISKSLGIRCYDAAKRQLETDTEAHE